MVELCAQLMIQPIIYSTNDSTNRLITKYGFVLPAVARWRWWSTIHDWFSLYHTLTLYCTYPINIINDAEIIPLQHPDTIDWTSVAKGFQDRWNLPHCIGAIDTKHFCIKAPPNSGSSFYNYKEFYSIVLIHMYYYLYSHFGPMII